MGLEHNCPETDPNKTDDILKLWMTYLTNAVGIVSIAIQKKYKVGSLPHNI